jgi:hypothetical protein
MTSTKQKEFDKLLGVSKLLKETTKIRTIGGYLYGNLNFDPPFATSPKIEHISENDNSATLIAKMKRLVDLVDEGNLMWQHLSNWAKSRLSAKSEDI